jgi:hypothetical protein
MGELYSNHTHALAGGLVTFGPSNAQSNKTINEDYYSELMRVQLGATPMYSGNKPLVICGGAITEAKDLDDAQRIAEEQAHNKSANAYILKPVRMVAPKRDVVTTDL